MLGAAKHLQYLIEDKQLQILRCAQDDSPTDFFSNLLEIRYTVDTLSPRIVPAGIHIQVIGINSRRD